MTEKQVFNSIQVKYQNIYRLIIPNIYFYNWESDIFCLDKDNLITEIETKVSKWDYLKDFQNKVDKHDQIENGRDYNRIPNKFIFAVDEKFVDKIDMPDYAGLIVIHQKGMQFNPVLVKKAPKIHTMKMNPERWEQLAISLAYKID